MATFKILHCADLHLEASFASSGLPCSVGDWRRDDLRATLGRIMALAREHKVDVVTIAGDLYEQDFALPDTANFIRQQFASLAPIRVFIAPGECDPYTHDSLYAITPWPDNVTIFPSNKHLVVDLAPEIHLWGIAHPLPRNLQTSGEFHANRQGINLLLLHSAGSRNTQASPLFRAEPQAIRAAGFDLALLGHQHNGQLLPEDKPCCVYPGSPEPLAAAEASADHQVILLTIKDGACSVQRVPTSQWRYLSLTVDLSSCETTEEAAKLVEKSLASLPNPPDDRTIARVLLTGCPAFILDREGLAQAVLTEGHVEYVSQLSMPYDLQQLAREQTIRGLLVRRFQTRLSKANDTKEQALILRALNLALQALERKQVRPL